LAGENEASAERWWVKQAMRLEYETVHLSACFVGATGHGDSNYLPIVVLAVLGDSLAKQSIYTA